MKKYLWVFAFLLGIAVVGVWRTQQPPGPESAPPSAKPAATQWASAGVPGPSRSAPTPPAPAPAAVPPPNAEVLHSDLTEVLPGLTAPTGDWRSFAPARLTVRPIPGVAIEFAAQRVTSDGRHTIWVGTNGTPGVTMVASGTTDRWDAVITVPEALEYDLHISAAGVTVEKKDFGADLCKPAGPAADSLATAMLTSSAATPAPAAEAAPVYTADVLILYTTAAGNSLGGASGVDNDVSALIANANNYLAQSQVDDLQWRLVGAVEATGYTETGNLTTDLNNLESRSTALGAFAAQQRNAYGADQVMLVVNSSTDGFAGIAETPGSLSVMVRAGSAGTLAHELAHNFNCHHDRLTDNAPDNDGEYYYGYRYTDTSGRDVGTIMSYAAYRVPYFSNPNLTYQGHVLGLAPSDPKAADNSLTLEQNASIVANYRTPVVTSAPVITGQPMSVTITAGQPFMLSVTATGGNLTYQWAHAGMNIPTATGASYSVSSSTTADAGSYTVTVSNSFGSVQSTAATVTVNTAAPAMTPAPSGSGSGGGGGSFDPWLALALLAVLAGAWLAGRSTPPMLVRRVPADSSRRPPACCPGTTTGR